MPHGPIYIRFCLFAAKYTYTNKEKVFTISNSRAICEVTFKKGIIFEKTIKIITENPIQRESL